MTHKNNLSKCGCYILYICIGGRLNMGALEPINSWAASGQTYGGPGPRLLHCIEDWERFIYLYFILYSLVDSIFVLIQVNSCTKDLITVFTWQRYPFQVVCLNVISYMVGHTFLSTQFAYERRSEHRCPIFVSLPIWNLVFGFLHQ